MYRLLAPLVALAILAGCEEIRDTGGTLPPGAELACPVGMQPAASAVVSVTDLQLDLLTAPFLFDPSADYNGQPAACVNAAGTEAQIVLTYEGRGQGIVTIFATEAGNFLLDEPGGASVRVVLDGPAIDEPLRVSGLWDLGSSMYVEQVGSTFSFNIADALATTSNDRTLLLNLYGELAVGP